MGPPFPQASRSRIASSSERNAGSGLRLDSLEQALDAESARADQRLRDRQASADDKRTLIDLNDLSLLRQKLGVRIIAPDHDEDVAAMHGVIARLGTDESEAANHLGIIEGIHIQRSIGVNDG